MSKIMDILVPFLKKWEGCRLKAYADQGGRVTIGWGHTGGVQMGTEWTQGYADQELLLDAEYVLKQVQELVKAPVTDNQMAALGSFTFNLGQANLARSGLLKYLNLRQYEKAADQFRLWIYIGLYKSPGLEARREAERELFLKS